MRIRNSCTTFAALGIVGLVGMLAATPASAVPITLQSSTVATGNQAYSGVGVRFLVNSPITVTALGLYDSGQDGFVGNSDHPLTADLMTSTGIIQASQTFAASSPGVL